MTDLNDAKPVVTSKKQRSAAYPSITLEQAIEYSKMILDAYRRNAFSREDAVKAMGYAKMTGDNAQRIAALGHFGLVDRDGNAYKNSALAESIYHFETDEGRLLDLKAAAQKPKLFRALLSDFNGQALPTRLAAILVRNHEINPNVAEKVADNFRKTLEFSGLISNGIVSVVFSGNDVAEGETGAESVQHVPVHTSRASQTLRTTQAPPAPQSPASPNMQSVQLPSGVEVSFPTEMAFLFITGAFAQEIAALDKKVSASFKKPEEPATQNEKGDATD